MNSQTEQKRRILLAGLIIDQINKAFFLGMTDIRISEEEKPLWLEILALAPDQIVSNYSDLTNLPIIVQYGKAEIAKRSKSSPSNVVSKILHRISKQDIS